MSNTIGKVIEDLGKWSLYTHDCFVHMEGRELCITFERDHKGVELDIYIQPNGSGQLPTTLEGLEQVKTTEHTFRVWNYAYTKILRKPTADELTHMVADSIY